LRLGQLDPTQALYDQVHNATLEVQKKRLVANTIQDIRTRKFQAMLQNLSAGVLKLQMEPIARLKSVGELMARINNGEVSLSDPDPVIQKLLDNHETQWIPSAIDQSARSQAKAIQSSILGRTLPGGDYTLESYVNFYDGYSEEIGQNGFGGKEYVRHTGLQQEVYAEAKLVQTDLERTQDLNLVMAHNGSDYAKDSLMASGVSYLKADGSGEMVAQFVRGGIAGPDEPLKSDPGHLAENIAGANDTLEAFREPTITMDQYVQAQRELVKPRNLYEQLPLAQKLMYDTVEQVKPLADGASYIAMHPLQTVFENPGTTLAIIGGAIAAPVSVPVGLGLTAAGSLTQGIWEAITTPVSPAGYSNVFPETSTAFYNGATRALSSAVSAATVTAPVGRILESAASAAGVAVKAGGGRLAGWLGESTLAGRGALAEAFSSVASVRVLPGLTLNEAGVGALRLAETAGRSISSLPVAPSLSVGELAVGTGNLFTGAAKVSGVVGRGATSLGYYTGKLLEPTVPLSVKAYGLQTLDGSFSFMGDRQTGNIGLIGALTRPSTIVWGDRANGRFGLETVIHNVVASVDGEAGYFTRVADFVASANKITTDVMSFGAGSRMASALAEGLFGPGMVSELAASGAMQAPMIPFYSDQIGNLSQAVSAFRSTYQSQGVSAALQTDEVKHFGSELGKMALGVAGAQGGLSRGSFETQAEASLEFAKNVVGESIKLGVIAAAGQVSPGLAIGGGIFQPMISEGIRSLTPMGSDVSALKLPSSVSTESIDGLLSRNLTQGDRDLLSKPIRTETESRSLVTSIESKLSEFEPLQRNGEPFKFLDNQREALVQLFSGKSIKLETSGGKSLAGAIFGAVSEQGQITYLAPTSDLAVKLMTETVNGVKLPEIIKQLNPNRNVYNIEQLYKDYTEHGNSEGLLKALRDPNGFLIMGRDSHGFIPLMGQGDPLLAKAWSEPLPNKTARRLLGDEIHKLAEPMAFVLGNSGDKSLMRTDSDWIKSEAMFKGKSGIQRLNGYDQYQAMEKANKPGYWYDESADRTYLTTQAMKEIEGSVRKATGMSLTSGEITEYYKGVGQWELGPGRRGAIPYTDPADKSVRVVPLDSNSTPQPNRTYHSSIYASAFALENGLGSESVRLTETKMQVAEAQAFQRYDSIQGMTATSDGARQMLQHKIGFEVAEIGSAREKKFTIESKAPEMTSEASNIREYIDGRPEGRFGRALAAGLTPEQSASFKRAAAEKGLSVMEVNGTDLENESLRDQVRGDAYQRYTRATEESRQTQYQLFDPESIRDATVAYDRDLVLFKNGQGAEPKMPVLKADVILLAGKAGMTGTDFRGDYYQFGDVSLISSSDFEQWIGRTERVNSAGSYFEAKRQFWVNETSVKDVLNRITRSQEKSIIEKWQSDGIKTRDGRSAADLLANRNSLSPLDRAELVRSYKQEVDSTIGQQAEGREAAFQTMSLEPLQRISRLVGEADKEFVSQSVRKATSAEVRDAAYAPETNSTDPLVHMQQIVANERNAAVKTLTELAKKVHDPEVAKEIRRFVSELQSLNIEALDAAPSHFTGRDVRTPADAVAYAKKLAKTMIPIQSSSPSRVIEAEAAINRLVTKAESANSLTDAELLHARIAARQAVQLAPNETSSLARLIAASPSLSQARSVIMQEANAQTLTPNLAQNTFQTIHVVQQLVPEFATTTRNAIQSIRASAAAQWDQPGLLPKAQSIMTSVLSPVAGVIASMRHTFPTMGAASGIETTLSALRDANDSRALPILQVYAKSDPNEVANRLTDTLIQKVASGAALKVEGAAQAKARQDELARKLASIRDSARAASQKTPDFTIDKRGSEENSPVVVTLTAPTQEAIDRVADLTAASCKGIPVTVKMTREVAKDAEFVSLIKQQMRNGNRLGANFYLAQPNGQAVKLGQEGGFNKSANTIAVPMKPLDRLKNLLPERAPSPLTAKGNPAPASAASTTQSMPQNSPTEMPGYVPGRMPTRGGITEKEAAGYMAGTLLAGSLAMIVLSVPATAVAPVAIGIGAMLFLASRPLIPPAPPTMNLSSTQQGQLVLPMDLHLKSEAGALTPVPASSSSSRPRSQFSAEARFRAATGVLTLGAVSMFLASGQPISAAVAALTSGTVLLWSLLRRTSEQPQHGWKTIRANA
jgi:hypothetical protein